MSSYRTPRNVPLAATVATLALGALVSACTDERPTGPSAAARPAASRMIPGGFSAAMGPTTPTCPISYGGLDNAKPNKIYLYFPAADDATYPEWGSGGLTTSPAHRFTATELPSYTGTTADLRAAVTAVVTDSYCEFNVQVRQTTTAPPATFARRNVVAIGTDAQGICGNETWGFAQAVDAGDPTAVDYSRVWAGSYQNCAGGAGGQLNGVNSTLQRWANAIGGTAAHEAGHNYGASHSAGLVLGAGEDPLVHHLMASGSHYSYADRAGYRRHFSNNEYSILASNVGLSVQTMWNWDLINPNAGTGRRFQMDFLSTKPSLILSWDYTGSRSPWVDPTVTGPLGTQVFKGVTYNRYRIEWSVGQAWDYGPAGQVPGGQPFHVGATFSGVNFGNPDPIIITATRLLDAGGVALPLSPRLVGYDAGQADAVDNALNLRFFNFAATPLIIQDIVVRQLPRLVSLDAMIPGGRMFDPMGEPFQPWSDGVRRVAERFTLQRGQELKIPLATLDQKPRVTQVVTERDCAIADRLKGPDVGKCRPGTTTDLFPSTALYVTATVIDPSVRYWDPAKKVYVSGLRSQLFYQIAGRRRSRLQ
jgi:hypothetical protein